MKRIITILILLISSPLWSQNTNVQWAYKILEVSSSKGKKEYSAIQALGMPNVSSIGKQNINAWEPKGEMEEEYLKVGFLEPIKPKQIIIVESYNPGYISKIFIYDADGKEYEVKSYLPEKVKTSSRILQISTAEFNFYVLSLKIVIKPEKNIPVGIDAIAITGSDKPYQYKASANDLIKANMVAKRLDTTVNSKNIEIGPLVSPDGKTLYFSRRGDDDSKGGVTDMEDIWFSKWDEKNQKWGSAQNMGRPLNNEEPNFINSISPDGNTILLGNSYLSDDDVANGVSVSRKTATGWTFPERLVIEDDDNNISRRTNYFESNSQKILLLSNNRKGDSHGERDLYVSFLKPDSTWTKPLNLGKTINTKGTEAAPFLASDDKTLYFTSDGHAGYGGSDIYMTRRLDDTWTKWSDPENLGPVVNTSYDESHLSITASGEQVYFTSASENGTDEDLYVIDLPKMLKPLPVMLISGRVLNSKTNAYIPGVKIFFEDLSTGQEVGIANSNPSNGEYQIVLPSGKNYGYLAQKDGFISVNSNIDLTTMPEYKEYKKDLYLTPIEVGETVIINNVFFDFDKYDLRKESFPELNRLVKLMQSNTTMKIEVSGNADSIGTQKYNEKLSYKRDEAVTNYLIAQSGIDKSRIVLKYYGELNPAASNATAKGRQLNRRVQFKVLAK